MPVEVTDVLEERVNRKYEAGFVTEVEQETFPPGLDAGQRTAGERRCQ